MLLAVYGDRFSLAHCTWHCSIPRGILLHGSQIHCRDCKSLVYAKANNSIWQKLVLLVMTFHQPHYHFKVITHSARLQSAHQCLGHAFKIHGCRMLCLMHHGHCAGSQRCWGTPFCCCKVSYETGPHQTGTRSVCKLA